MARQRRHTVNCPRPSMQDVVAADSKISSTNCDPGSSSRGTLSLADHEVVDATTQTRDQTAAIHVSDMSLFTGAGSDSEDVSTVAQSRSDGLLELMEAFTQLGTGDESRSNPRSGAPSFTAPIPVAANGLYELFDHVPRQTFLRLVRDIPMISFDAFVGVLVQTGLLDWEDDDLPINPATRVAIMALTFQQLASPANLNLSPDVVERIFIDVSKAIGILCGSLSAPQWVLDVATKLRGLKDM